MDINYKQLLGRLMLKFNLYEIILMLLINWININKYLSIYLSNFKKNNK